MHLRPLRRAERGDGVREDGVRRHVWYDARCGKCGGTIECGTEVETRKEAIEIAKALGWKYVNSEWICRKCRAPRTKGQR